MCDIISAGDMNKCILNSKVKIDTAKVQLSEPINFTGVTEMSIIEVFPSGSEITRRKPCHQKPAPAWVTAHKSWKPAVHCTIRRTIRRRVPFPGHLDGPPIFQTAHQSKRLPGKKLVSSSEKSGWSASSRQLRSAGLSLL